MILKLQYDLSMKPLITLIFVLTLGTAYGQSNLTVCQGNDDSKWSNCFGTFANQNGYVYIGEYQQGVPNGAGQSLNAVGQKYIGNFKNGVFVGKVEATKNNVTVEVVADDYPRAPTGKPKCYLTTVPIQPPIKSCDPNLIQRSLTGFDIVGMLRFNSTTEMEFILIRPQSVSENKSKITSYKISGNLITTEPVPNCFITNEVEDGVKYRKELFVRASSGCPEYLVNAGKVASEELKSGRNKGFLIVYE